VKRKKKILPTPGLLPVRHLSRHSVLPQSLSKSTPSWKNLGFSGQERRAKQEKKDIPPAKDALVSPAPHDFWTDHTDHPPQTTQHSPVPERHVCIVWILSSSNHALVVQHATRRRERPFFPFRKDRFRLHQWGKGRARDKTPK
jgi:hypothetical protein